MKNKSLSRLSFLKKKFSGFTLIELLVVIAIIGLISSIVLVSLKGTSGKAKIAKSLEFSQTIQHALGSEAAGIWNFDEGSGTTALDTSGYGKNGTIFGASYTDETPQKLVGTGAGKYALSFSDEFNECVEVYNFPQLLGDKTIVAWVFEYSHGSEGDAIATTTDCGWGTNGYCFGINNIKHLKFRIGNGATAEQKESSLSVPLNIWNFVAMVYDSTQDTVTFYVNGKRNGPYQYTTVLNHVSSNILSIGGEDCSGNEWGINGLIDDVRIYSAALTQAEIQKHYVEGLEKYKNIVLNY